MFSSLLLRWFRVRRRVCVFILSADVIGLSRHLMILMRISNLITNVQYIFISLTDFFHSYFIKAIDHSFYGFTGAINHLVCWADTRKACKSPNGSWFASFSRVLPTSRMVYCASKPIERVVYCLSKGRTFTVCRVIFISNFITCHWHFYEVLIPCTFNWLNYIFDREYNLKNFKCIAPLLFRGEFPIKTN